MLVESGGLPPDSTCVLEAKPSNLESKRVEPGILFISLQVFFTLQISEYDVIINFPCCFNVIIHVIQNGQRQDDLIKALP